MQHQCQGKIIFEHVSGFHFRWFLKFFSFSDLDFKRYLTLFLFIYFGIRETVITPISRYRYFSTLGHSASVCHEDDCSIIHRDIVTTIFSYISPNNYGLRDAYDWISYKKYAPARMDSWMSNLIIILDKWSYTYSYTMICKTIQILHTTDTVQF